MIAMPNGLSGGREAGELPWLRRLRLERPAPPPEPDGAHAGEPAVERAAKGALRAEGISLAFSGLQVLEGVDLDADARRGARADRPERRRQDDARQRPQRLPGPRLGHRQAGRSRRHRPLAGPPRPRRPGPHVPGRPPLPPPERPRERRRRRDGRRGRQATRGGGRRRRARPPRPARAGEAARRLAAAGEPAPAGDRPRPRDRAALPAARRARGRAERGGVRGAGRDPARRARGLRLRDPADRARHERGHGPLLAGAGARRRQDGADRHPGGDPGRPRRGRVLPRQLLPGGAPMLELRELRVGYGGVEVVHGVDLSARPREKSSG